jgi:transcriptional regulator with XRE-family HTH domain
MTGDELREVREQAGLGLRELAGLIGKNHGHLSRVERGKREATPSLVAAYRSALTAPTVEDVRRRDVLAAGAAMPVLATLGARQRVGTADVSAVRALALDLDLTHPLTVHAAQSALSRAAAMLNAKATPAMSAALHSAVALLADRVGWGMLETGADPVATMSYAQRIAQSGDDVNLYAHAVLDLAVATRDPALAVEILEHALAGAVDGAERVNLHAVAARRAALIRPRLAAEHLARALDHEPAPVPGEWADRTVNAPGHLDAIIGFACYAVGHDEARDRLTGAVTQLGPHRRRTRARAHARLAGLAVREGETETAAGHLQRARTDRSALVVADLSAFAVEARRCGQPALARLASYA